MKKSGKFPISSKVTAKLLFLFLFFSLSALFASPHSVSSGEAFTRVVSADPSSRTYTFSCRMEPENTFLRDWFIRPDNGDTADDQNEAEILDRQSGEFLTYTFKNNTFYHVGCLVVKEPTFDVVYRGDLHIDLRKTSWNPTIVPLSGNGLASTLECRYSSTDYTASWEVINAQTLERSSIGTGKILSHTAPYHGLFDYICNIKDNTNGKTLS